MPEAAVELRLTAARLQASGREFSETFRGGEIVGLAGLEGHGQERLIEALAGLLALEWGRVELSARGAVQPVRDYGSAARAGVAYLPRERRLAGVFPNLSVLDNFAIASLESDVSHGLIRPEKRLARFQPFRDRLSIIAKDLDGPITRLSGGNQQKVLLARLLTRSPAVLLLNDPTRGVDVATRKVFYGVLRELADDGMALVVLSTEIEELAGLCDRVLVFREFELATRLGGEQLSYAAVIAAMFGETP